MAEDTVIGLHIATDGTVTEVTAPRNQVSQVPRDASKSRAVNPLLGQVFEYPVTFFFDAWAARRRRRRNDTATSVMRDAIFNFEGLAVYGDVWVFGATDDRCHAVDLHPDVIALVRETAGD